MSFVDDDVFPRELLQRGFLELADLIRSDAHIEILSEYNFLTYPSSFLLLSSKDESLEARYPVRELSLPVVQCGFRDDDKMWTGNITVEFEVAEEGNSL